jgi:hypothetical protein
MRRQFEVGVLWCPNPSTRRRVASGNARRTGWVFPPAVEKQLIKDCEGKRVLQLFGGQSSFGTRLDIDITTRPDVLADAWLPPFAKDSFDVVILDPPYIHLNAQMKTALFRAAGWIAKERVVWFSTVWMAASGGLSTEAAWLVRVGDSCAARALQYFRVSKKFGPVTRFNRGPAMKYNRWLAQSSSLPFIYGERPESPALSTDGGVAKETGVSNS